MTTFIEYLKEIYEEDYGKDDSIEPYSFEAWLADLDQDEIIEHAENAIKIARGDL